ncbi:MAG: ATP-binding cassette domain-containing protein, partial [Mesorhizobium sp.]
MSNLVEVRNLRIEATTDAGRLVEIIKGVSLDIADGEIVALIGESGSGKTTVSKILMRAVTPSGGSVIFNGRDGPIDVLGGEGDALRLLRAKIQ